MQPLFADRRDAGRKLAALLAPRFKDEHPVVLALPRGGLPVAYEVAVALGAPLDILLVRKIGAPGHPEFGLGAIVDGSMPEIVLNPDVLAKAPPPQGYFERECERQLDEIERRRRLYLGDRPPEPITGRCVIVVDDGIATGGTVRAALRALKRHRPRRLVLATPVAPPEVFAAMADEADDIFCLVVPQGFRAVGLFYLDFRQITDDEAVMLLEEARAFFEHEEHAEAQRALRA